MFLLNFPTHPIWHSFVVPESILVFFSFVTIFRCLHIYYAAILLFVFIIAIVIIIIKPQVFFHFFPGIFSLFPGPWFGCMFVSFLSLSMFFGGTFATLFIFFYCKTCINKFGSLEEARAQGPLNNVEMCLAEVRFKW